MNFSIEISNEDFFRLLKHKIPTSYSTRYECGLGEKIIFKESIDVLERIDHFARDVSDDIWDADSLTFKFRHRKDQLQLAEFCDSFNKLRFQKNLFPHPEIFNHLFLRIVYETYRQFDQTLELELRQKYGIDAYKPLPKEKLDEYAEAAFIYGTHQQIAPWSIRTIPYERIAQLITEVRNRIERGIDDCYQLEKNTLDKSNQQAAVFDRLLQTHSSIYVFAIDVRIQGFFRPNAVSLSSMDDMYINNLYNIKLLLARVPHLLSGLIKVETNDAKEDLNLHCILMLKPSNEFSETNSIGVLQQQIQNLVGHLYQVRIRNWNEVIRKNYSKTAVGLIKASKQNYIKEFKYWVLSFFFKLDLYIQPHLPSQQLKSRLTINETLDTYLGIVPAQSEFQSQKNENIVESSLKELEKVNKALSDLFRPFLSEKEHKSVWAIDSLPEMSQAYIEAVTHYYRETESDPQRLQFMMHIEIFIETLVTTRLMAFELSVSDNQEFLTRQILRKAVTRLGRQFILLGENEVDDLVHPRYAFLIQEIFEKSRATLQQLASFEVHRNTIDEVNYHILALRRLYTSSLKRLGDDSIQKISNDSYKKYKRRLDDVTKLFKCLFQRDCLIFRVTLELIPESKYISNSDLFILWSEFLHHARNAKPLSWKIGYIGLWRVDEDQNFYADVFFIFEDRAFANVNSIIQQLNDKWIKFIIKHAQSKLNLNEKPEFKCCRIQGKPLMMADVEYTSDHLFIESTNKARKDDFLHKIIPAFLSHSLFEEAFIEAYKQIGSGLLIKSSTAVAARKNAPAPKLIRQKALKKSVDCTDDTNVL
ncbi:MAG: hypothetical protein RR487_00515 [Acinetobacter sp.]